MVLAHTEFLRIHELCHTLLKLERGHMEIWISCFLDKTEGLVTFRAVVVTWGREGAALLGRGSAPQFATVPMTPNFPSIKSVY